jgi:hypothetical protein
MISDNTQYTHTHTHTYTHTHTHTHILCSAVIELELCRTIKGLLDPLVGPEVFDIVGDLRIQALLISEIDHTLCSGLPQDEREGENVQRGAISTKVSLCTFEIFSRSQCHSE